MNVAMQLRKCCNHPYLLEGVEDDVLLDSATKEPASFAHGRNGGGGAAAGTPSRIEGQSIEHRFVWQRHAICPLLKFLAEVQFEESLMFAY